MRVILNDIVYDTETAELLASREKEIVLTAYDCVKEELYRNQNGNYFTVGYSSLNEAELLPIPSKTTEAWIAEVARDAPKPPKPHKFIKINLT